MSMSLEYYLSEGLTDAERQERAEELFPALPFDGPGMPPPGVDFINHAVALGDEIDATAVQKKKTAPTTKHLIYCYRRAMYDRTFSMPITGKRGLFTAQFVPGHLIGNTDTVTAYGPTPAKIMVVGKIPGIDNLRDKNAIVGSGMGELFRALEAVGVSRANCANWYVTFACKFSSQFTDIDIISAAWLKNCAPILAQELRLVRPDYILCLGNDATKAVTNSAAKLNGRVATIKIPITDTEVHEAKVFSVTHPAYVARKPDAYDDFEAQIKRFVALTQNAIATTEEVDHAEIYTEEALSALVDAMIADPDPNANIIAVDCEWHGDYPTEPGAYLRTVQISNRDKWARTVVLRYEGGAEAFRPNLDAAKKQLTRLLKSTTSRCVRVGGHFLRADLPWLIDFGVDVRDEYAPAADPNDRLCGGWDTSLMYHAVNETAKYGLDECSLRFTSAPAYWERLDQWKKSYRTLNKIKSDDLGGYGECPSHILHPYANYDADVTRRVMMYFYGTNGTDGAIAKDAYGNDCWLPYWTAHQASLAFLEMEMTGLVVDRDRADKLTTIFMQQQDQLLEEVRAELQWESFNPKSHPQLAVALFGRAYLKNFTNAVNIPESAKTLDLTPIKTTGKRPKLWIDLSQIEAEKSPPSTDKESLGILGHQNFTAAKIRDYKFIAQVLQSVLRKPITNDDGAFELNEEGHFQYEKGILGSVHSDGKVRTHLFQTKETGRASSSRPPLQNLSSRREDDYKRILRDNYSHPVRSILCVPDGYIGFETDLTGAELAVLAWLAQDSNMIEHVRRNLLPEKHPDHYDIHSRQAVKTFNLRDVEPTKSGMKAAGVKGLRVAAKNVNFGIPYGRGAEAIARQCKEEGEDVTPEQCQAMIDAYFGSYPGTAVFLEECRKRSQNPGWLVGPYGRYRRFVPPNQRDRNWRATVGEQQRQAQNFPIQGGVADAVSLALNNFRLFRKEHPEIDFKIALQIHDAIVLFVPFAHAAYVYEHVIPECMVTRLPFWPRFLDGRPMAVKEPYHFGMSRDVFTHWGENLNPQQVADMGLKDLADVMED